MEFLLPSLSLWRREMVRFFRQPNRIIGAIGTPVFLWVMLAAGMSGSFSGEVSYGAYFFPGIAILIVHFTAIFSTISIIEDRREGFLQSVLVAPVSRGSIVMGKVLGGTCLAVMQAALFLGLAPVAGIQLGLVSILASLGVLTLVGFALTGLGFMIAWKMDTTQGFHAIMNLFLMPMWFLSGAVFPADKVPDWLGIVMLVNPLSYGVSALRGAMTLDTAAVSGIWTPVAVTAAFALVTFVCSGWIVSHRSVKGVA